MGTIKFYNGGQSVTESVLFGLTDIYTAKANYSLSVYPAHTYTDNELTTENGSLTYPYLKFQSNSTESQYNAYYKRIGIPGNGGNYTGVMFGSSDAINDHDKTFYTFHNSVASIDYLSESTYNGVKTMVLSMTNLDSSNSVTVRSVQRSNKFLFVSNPYNISSSNHRNYLDWAYYFDEDEYITLEPGETKSVVINFTLSDLTA